MNVLVSALDWGLGHTNRMIPVIAELQSRNCDVVFVGSRRQVLLIKESFISLDCIYSDDLGIRYSEHHSQIMKIARFIPRFIKHIRNDRKISEKIIKEFNIDLIISDNRYGFRSDRVHSVFITHQTNLILPEKISFLTPLLNRINRKLISRFNECLVPDVEAGNGFTGKLGHDSKLNIPITYIGVLSRFRNLKSEIRTGNKIDLLIIISGPEKQRTVFETIIIEQVSGLAPGIKWHIIRGLPQMDDHLNNKRIQNHVAPNEYLNLLLRSEYIICRSGYSTIMDLLLTGKKALLVPTPGQTEQEYLADYLADQGYFLTESQQNVNLNRSIEELEKFKSRELPGFSDLYKADLVVKELIDRCNKYKSNNSKSC